MGFAPIVASEMMQDVLSNVVPVPSTWQAVAAVWHDESGESGAEPKDM